MKASEIGKLQVHKEHQRAKSGKRVKDAKAANVAANKTRGTNMKATAVQNVREMRYKLEKQARIEFATAKLPTVKHDGGVAPPDMVAIIGSPGAGKTTLVKALVKSYTNKSVTAPAGPITVSVATQKRVTLFDCPSSLPAVLDIARVVDLVILVLDASKGIQTDVYEYLNVLQAIGFPKVFTVLTHQDKIEARYFKTRKTLRERIYKEIAAGAKVFDMPFIEGRDTYKREKVDVLARCIAQQHYQQPLQWRTQHGCVLVDRVEPKDDGNLVCFGFVRGTFIGKTQDYHIPGYADVALEDMEALPDPALPEQKLILNKHKPVLYAPMSEVGDIKVDADAIRVRVNDNRPVGKAAKAMAIIQKINTEDNAVGNDQMQLFEDDDEIVQDFEHKDQPDAAESSVEEEQSGQDGEANPWLDAMEGEDEQAPDDAGDLVSESTDERLDIEEEDLGEEQHQFLLDEEEEEPESESEEVPQTTENEAERVRKLLSKMRLERPQASKQYYRDLLYSSAPAGKSKAPRGKKQTNLLQLFSDSEDENVTFPDLISLPRRHAVNFQVFDAQPRDSSRVFPINAVLTNRSLTIPDSGVTQERLGKYFLDDTDFVEALHRCLDGDLAEEQPQEGATAKGAEKSKGQQKMQLQIDGHFLEEKEQDVRRATAREALLDPSLTLVKTRFAPGEYVRFSFAPTDEFVKNFNQKNPLLLGGLLPQENQRQFITAKVKRHRWFPRVLKTRNPVVIACGWRRFQTLPFYGIAQENKTEAQFNTGLVTETPPIRLLKYTPEHMHCQCVFYGYKVPAGSGLIAFQDPFAMDFRICLTGVVQEASHDVKIYKKLKLVGYCEELFKNSAFIGRMFANRLEAAAFTGAGIRTVSGIRGIIKKPNGESGQVRCTFEDKIRKNDTVFLKTYIRCKVDKVFIEWSNHADLSPQFIKQMVEIRQEQNVPLTYKADSVYAAEKRPVFVKQDFVIQPSFVKQLPFEQAKQYLEERTGKRRMDDVEYAQKQIKSKTLKTLVTDEQQQAKKKQIQELERLNALKQRSKEERKRQEQYAQEKWNEGMARKRNEQREDEEQLRRKSKRMAMQKTQAKSLKNGALEK